MNIDCRTETVADIDSIYQLNCEAFETDAEARLVNSLRNANKLVLSLVVAIDNKVVGHVAFSHMKTEFQKGRKLVGLGPMAVAKKMQRQGIGAAMIREAERLLMHMGYDAIFLLGHKDYYPKFGYKPSNSNFGIKSKYDVDDEYFMVKPLSDQGINGLTGTVFYESEFDSL